MSTIFVGIALPGLAIVLATATSLGLRRAFRRRRSLLAGFLSSVLVAPVLVVVGLQLRLTPGVEELGRAAPWIVLALSLGLASLAVPISATVGALVFNLQRRPTKA